MMIDADALTARLGRFGPSDLPRYAEDGGARILVDGTAVDDGFDLVVTVDDDAGDTLADELVIRDARGHEWAARINRRGQLRFDHVEAPPWLLRVGQPG